MRKFILLIILIILTDIVFADEIRFDFNNNYNIECDSQKVEIYKGKLRLSPTGFWTNRDEGISEHWLHPMDLFQDSKKSMFYIGIDPGPNDYMYRSTNYGINWTNINISERLFTHIIETCNGHLYISFDACPAISAYGGVKKSTNNGNNWFWVLTNSLNTINTQYGIHSIIEDHNHNIYASGSLIIWPSIIKANLFFKSTNNGTSWIVISSNTNNLIFYSLFELNNGDLLAQSTNSLYLSSDFGTNWSLINGTSGLGSFNGSWGGFLRASDNSIYVYGNLIGRSIDEGKTWEQISDDVCFKFVESLDGIFYKTCNSNVWKSFDKGYTWQKTVSIITNCGSVGSALIEADDGKLYCGTHFTPSTTNLLFRSGFPASSQIILNFTPEYVIKWLSFSKSDILNDGSIIYEFAYSIDKGNSWSDWLSPTDYNLQNIRCLGNGEDRLKVRITLNSLDHDKTPQIDWISLQYDDGYKDNLDDIIVAPNPFRPYKDNIDYVMFYNLPEVVKISIYSVGGGEIFHKKANSIAGRYKWDVKNSQGSNLRSGVYFCCIKDNNGNEKNLKLVVIR